MTGYPTGTVTFLFSDNEGSTRLAREHPETWETARAQHHDILRAAIEAHHGVVFQVIGDAFCAAFHKAGEALTAALSVQQELQRHTWGVCVIRVRMGIHTGEAEVKDNEYEGYLTLSLVQRLMSAGHGGQVLVSGATEYLLRGQPLQDIPLRDMGVHTFKDAPNPTRVFQAIAPGLQNEFPPLRVLDTIPTNLPSQLTSFIGREREVADVKSLLENTRLLTLVGPGGTGKTRLSLQVAMDVLSSYPHGVWFIELAPVSDPLSVPAAVLSALNLPAEVHRSAIEMLCDYLREKETLLILDNCEHLIDACARMADRLLHASPRLRILASSREALGVAGEVSYRVPSLGLPDLKDLPPVESLSQYEAVRLFIDRARAAQPSFQVTDENAPAVAQICHRLDGIPLALELAAVKVRALSVEQIAKRLYDQLRLLTGGSRTALERHQTLRATLDWSHNLLPPSEQILLRRLSIFVNGWTLEAAESVCADESLHTEDIFGLLEQLVNKSLVSTEPWHTEVRYRMLETVRQYAGEKLINSGESEALRDKHLEYFLNLVEIAEPHLTRPEQLEWLAKLDADYENLRLTLEWALSKEVAEPSLCLCAALGWYWWVRGHWLEGTKWLDNALNKPGLESKNEKIYRVRALYWDAALANYLDDLERMKTSAEGSLALAQTFSDRRDIAIARFYVGWSFDRSYDYDNAVLLMQESLRDFQQIYDLYWESVVYRWLANILANRGIIKWEEKLFHHLELARRAGEGFNLAEALSNWAYSLFASNRLEDANMFAEEASVLLKRLGIRFDYELGFFFAHVEWEKGNYTKARDLLMEMRNRYSTVGDRNFQSRASADLGFLALEERDLYHAHMYLEEALSIAQEIGNKESIAMRLAELGNTFYLKDKIREFKQSYQEGFTIAKELGIVWKRSLLVLFINTIHDQKPENSVKILGALYKSEIPTHPLWKRLYDRPEAVARALLGETAFEATFAEGQKISLDEAIVLALKTLDEL